MTNYPQISSLSRIARGRGELLATDTTEALRVVRHGDWVVKQLRPTDSSTGSLPLTGSGNSTCGCWKAGDMPS